MVGKLSIGNKVHAHEYSEYNQHIKINTFIIVLENYKIS